MTRTWTDEADAHAKACWLAGLSASQTADSLRHTLRFDRSRNAVIGRIYRLGLSNVRKQHPTRPRALGQPRARLSLPGPPRVRVAAVEAPGERQPKPVAVTMRRPHSTTCAVVIAGNFVRPGDFVPETARATLDLRPHDCKYPVGAATGMDQLHCGARCAEDYVYCTDHRRLCGGVRIAPADRAPLKRLPYWARS